jgi:hypothetical protein
VAGHLEDLLTIDFGGPLHSLVLAGECHEMEIDMLRPFMTPRALEVPTTDWDQYTPESGMVAIPEPIYRGRANA